MTTELFDQTIVQEIKGEKHDMKYKTVVTINNCFVDVVCCRQLFEFKTRPTDFNQNLVCGYIWL